MNTQQDHYEQIEDYLADSLSDTERQAFETRLHSDTNLARQVNLHRQLQQAIVQEKGDRTMQQAIQQAAKHWEADEQPVGRTIRFQPKIYWAAASVGVLLLSAVFFGVFQRDNPSAQALFDEQFVAYEAPVLFRSTAIDTLVLQKAYVAYQDKAYVNAIALFTETLHQNPNQIVPYFYIGQSKLAMGDAVGAIPTFQTVIDHKNNAYVTQATWYLALAYLKIGDRESATAQLRTLTQRQDVYGKKATALLEQLNK